MSDQPERENQVTVEVSRVTVVTSLTGATLAAMFEGAAGLLEQNVPEINALNVFPVPDGDTGTNMMLTVQSALAELRKSEDSDPVATVASKIARGALMGARGNSGVILSQILRGLANGLEGKTEATATDFVRALEKAQEMAYKAVQTPVEGTILTVIREVADAAREHHEASEDHNMLHLLARVVEAAKESELRTPDLLPVLKQAGVTDAGGNGLYVILHGFLRRLRGETIAPASTKKKVMDQQAQFLADAAAQIEALEDGEWGYDIQYLVKARPGVPIDVDAMREHIGSIGDCALVVGDETLVKVHVHCPNPGPAIEYGAEQGSIFDVVVEDMDEQADEFLGEESSDAPPVAATATDEVTGVGIVAVGPGEGLAEIFRSLGVSEVVSGGQTMNPSTRDLLEAAERVNSDTVIILPNNKNIILAAEQVPALTEKTVHVLPTRTVPQGIAALMSFNYGAAVETNLAAMTEAARHVQTGEVTTAVRTTNIDGIDVREGAIIGILNGKLVISDDDVGTVVRGMLDRLDLDEYEIATFYYGQPLDKAEAEQLVAGLEERYDMLEFDTVAGGQPHYHFIFSVE